MQAPAFPPMVLAGVRYTATRHDLRKGGWAMHLKVFLTTILGLAIVTVTGFATWLFPLVNHIHQQLGGQPLQDPRGSVEDQINTWLSFLPSNNIERTQIVCFVIAAYLVVTSLITLLTVQAHHRRARRMASERAHTRTLHLLAAEPEKAIWVPRVVKNRYWREATLDVPNDQRAGHGR
jgi:hypothetical protein